MITIDREHGTDYLFAGFLERALRQYKTQYNVVLHVEPHMGELYFSQDYIKAKREANLQFVFYSLPSLREYFEKEMDGKCALVTYAADRDHHIPQKVEKIYDVGFIGRPYYEDRNEYLKTIEKVYPTSFFNKYDIPGFDIPKYYSQCKVLFNHTRPEIDVNLRFFEQMALGCQVMLRTPALKEFAVEGEHYMGYSSQEELVEVLDRLLKDDELRESITKKAREHFLAHHTYQHRAEQIISALDTFYL